MEVSFLGGPKAGEFLQVASPPDAFEFPIYTTNGGCSETCRYERIGKTCQYDFQGKHTSKQPLEAPPEKSVVIRKPKQKDLEHSVKHGKLVWNEKKGRYTLQEDKSK